MSKIRIGAFNCENLFARFKFVSNVDPPKAITNGFNINMTEFDILSEKEKTLTGHAIVPRQINVAVLSRFPLVATRI